MLRLAAVSSPHNSTWCRQVKGVVLWFMHTRGCISEHGIFRLLNDIGFIFICCMWQLLPLH